MWQLTQYGSAAQAMELLWRFDLLHHVLPTVDQLFLKQRVPRCVCLFVFVCVCVWAGVCLGGVYAETGQIM